MRIVSFVTPLVGVSMCQQDRGILSRYWAQIMSRNWDPVQPATVRTRKVEWRTVALIAGCYGVWLAAGTIGWSLSPWLAIVALTLTVALQSSLMHEAAHGHPTRNGVMNEALVGLPNCGVAILEESPDAPAGWSVAAYGLIAPGH